MATLITGPGQIEWQGLLLGDGTDYHVQSLTGWREMPGVDTGNVNRPLVHGAWSGRVLAQERIVTAELTIFPADGDVGRALAALEAVTAPAPDAAEYELAVADLDGTPRVAYGQVTRRALPLQSGYGQKLGGVAIQWNCADARLFGAIEQQAATTPPTGGSGLTYPLVYPLDYGVPGSTGGVRAVNDGNVPASPVLEIDGPCVLPRVVNQTTGRQVVFDLTLAAGERLTVDCRAGTALLNGEADRLYTISPSSTPPENLEIVPGSNDIAFRAQSNGPGALLTVLWRDAWL